MEELKRLLCEWLQSKGFFEAEKCVLRFSQNFYKEDTELTAFFVNVKERAEGLGVCFGLASTAFTRMSGCENSLKEHGILNEDSCLRQYMLIREKYDVSAFVEKMSTLIKQYEGMTKNTLLQMLKENRKAFLNSIHEVLKPLGFKKKGNEWRIHLPDGYILYFHADKNPYCDSYEFDVMIHTQDEPVRRCTYELLSLSENPVNPEVPCRFDWQMNSREELMNILNQLLEEYVKPAQEIGMMELGKRDRIHRCRKCETDRCDSCWIVRK